MSDLTQTELVVIEAETQPAIETEQLKFDYEQIAIGHRERVMRAAETIHEASKTAIDSIIRIGLELVEVKKRIEHGQFEAWIKAEFALELRTAQNWMNVAREYNDPQKRNIISLFSPTVAYLLAAPSTPDEARAEVEQAAAAGQKVTVEFAKEAIRKAKPEPVTYAPIHALEGVVKAWLTQQKGAFSTPDPDVILDSLKTQTRETLREGSWLDLLDKWIAAQGVQFRKSDLTQAINNVREQRRQAKLQASGRAVYVQPVEKAASQDIVLAVREEATAEGTEQREADEALLAEIWSEDMVRHLVHVSRTDPINSRVYRAALQNASLAQLQKALQAYAAAVRLYKWRDKGEREAEIEERIKVLSDAQGVTAPADDPALDPNRPGYGRNKDYAMRPHEEYYPVKHGMGVMPADLVAAGYTLVDGDGGDKIGTLGYRWKFGDEMGDDVAYAGFAIEAAREHWAARQVTTLTADELEAMAIVEAEREQEDAQRAEREQTRQPGENVPAIVEPTKDDLNDEPYGMFDRSWVMQMLSSGRADNSDFLTALNQLAKADDLREALTKQGNDKFVLKRTAAIKQRLEAMAAPTATYATVEQLVAVLGEWLAGYKYPWAVLNRVGANRGDPGSAWIEEMFAFVVERGLGEFRHNDLWEAFNIVRQANHEEERAAAQTEAQRVAEKSEREKQAAHERAPEQRMAKAIAQAKEGLGLIQALRSWTETHYQELTGHDHDPVGLWRDTATMVGRLESVVAVAGGGADV